MPKSRRHKSRSHKSRTHKGRHRPRPPQGQTARPAADARATMAVPGKRPLPAFDTLAEAERFLATADLDAYDLSPFDAAVPDPAPDPAPDPTPDPTPPRQAAPQFVPQLAPRFAPESGPQFVSGSAPERADPRPAPFPQQRPQPQHEYAPKSARLTMRLPETLLQALKAHAQAAGLPYQRLIRQALERAVGDGS